MTRPRLFAAAAATGLALVLSGCSSGSPGDITPAAAKVLRPAVEAVRQAVASHSYSTLRSAVHNLLQLVDQEQQSGGVSPSRATAMEDAAQILLTDASPSPSPTPVPTTTSPTPTPTTTSPTPSQTTTPPPVVTTTPPPPPSSSPAGPLGPPGGGGNDPSAKPGGAATPGGGGQGSSAGPGGAGTPSG
jgi:hypothetical protein